MGAEVTCLFVTPAKAGVSCGERTLNNREIPASAGMTDLG
jgi:hypothetical protein